MNFPWRQVLATAGSILLGVLVAAVVFGVVKIEKAPTPDYKYALDVTTFGLTLVQILLALLAIGIAALAVVGYSDIRNAATAKAAETAEESCEGLPAGMGESP